MELSITHQNEQQHRHFSSWWFLFSPFLWLVLMMFTNELSAKTYSTDKNQKNGPNKDRSQTGGSSINQAPPAALPGLNADPHIAFFEGKYFIYPTTDDGNIDYWSSTSFRCWSSENLKDWKNEGIILDLPRDITWAKDKAWAPCIAGANGKYYFYFSAGQQIGVAESDRPQGPFKDALGKPLVNKDSYDTQVIDPMVFTDDDQVSYLYFGSGNLNVVKLNCDMISFDASSVKKISSVPFAEGMFVFKRRGIYYLMFSRFGTDSPDYSVWYATSTSPFGPFILAANNPVLRQKGIIKGTGHNSVIQIPGRDEWVIAYHRFRIPNGNGFHRETCLSPMRFDDNGQIHKVDVFDTIPSQTATPPETKLQAPDKGVLPGLRKLMDIYLRDPSICRGGDHWWYLTGTINPPEGIQVWKSKDLISWESLGIVWKPGNSPWHKPYLQQGRPLWAPEIHYIRGTFWLTYSMPGWDANDPSRFNPANSGCGLLKSTSGKPEGPYSDVQPDERLGDEIDASLFQDDDDSVYYLWHSGKIAKMKPDMSGLAEPYHWLKPAVADPDPQHHSGLCPKIFGKDSLTHIGYEGVFMFKSNGLYYLCGSDRGEGGRYSCYISTSRSIYGPYSKRYEALPYCGHNMFFQDDNAHRWSTFFGQDGIPWHEQPGILPVTIGADNIVCSGKKK